MTAEQFSSHVESLRLHKMALKHECINPHDDLSTLENDEKIPMLFGLLLKHLVGTLELSCKVSPHPDTRALQAEVPEIAQIVDRACSHQIEFGPTHFPPPREERKLIQVPFFNYNDGLWQAIESLKLFKADLQIYRELQNKLPAPQEDEDKLKNEFNRHLYWLRQVQKTQADEAFQQQCVDEIIHARLPDAPVRVEVNEGQDLQQAIFSALFSATQTQSSNNDDTTHE